MAIPLILVADSNVLIDLQNGDVLGTALSLPHKFVSPDVVIGELRNPPPESVKAMGLEDMSLGPDLVQETIRLASIYRKPSTPDLFALVLARHISGSVLSGDGDLRNACKAEGIPVVGTLWVFDQLVELERLSPAAAAKSLELILACKTTRLPLEECSARLKTWRK